MRGLPGLQAGRPVSAQEHLERAMAGFAARPAEQRVSPLVAAAQRPGRGRGRRAGRRERRCAASWTTAERWDRRPCGGPRRSALRAVRTASPSSRSSYGAWIQPLPRRRRGPRAAGRGGRRHRPGARLRLLDGVRRRLGRHRHAGRPRRTGTFLEQTLAILRCMGQRAFRAAAPGASSPAWTRRPATRAARTSTSPRPSRRRRSGEDLHLPELLRQRARFALARRGRRSGGGRPDRGRAHRDRAGRPGVPPARRGGPRGAATRPPARGLADPARGGAGGHAAVGGDCGADGSRRAAGGVTGTPPSATAGGPSQHSRRRAGTPIATLRPALAAMSAAANR